MRNLKCTSVAEQHDELSQCIHPFLGTRSVGPNVVLAYQMWIEVLFLLHLSPSFQGKTF